MKKCGISLILSAWLLSLSVAVFALDEIATGDNVKHIGKVASISKDKITLEDKSFAITRNTKIYDRDKKKINWKDIKRGETINVTTKPDNGIALEIGKGGVPINIDQMLYGH